MTAGYQTRHFCPWRTLLPAVVCLSPWAGSPAYPQKETGEQAGASSENVTSWASLQAQPPRHEAESSRPLRYLAAYSPTTGARPGVIVPPVS